MEYYKFSQYNIVVGSDEQYTILYNSYSGGIIKLENETYRQLTESKNVDKDALYAKELIENGFFVNSKVDEYQKVKLQLEQAINGSHQTTISYTIAPTLACNMNCIYCFEKAQRQNNKNSLITEEMLDKILSFILRRTQDNRNVQNIKIIWFGGEPLLCYEQMVLFGKKLKIELSKRNIGLITSIITNGALLDESKLQVLTNELDLKRLQITLDGEEETYCHKKQTDSKVYKKVLKNVCLATNYVKTVIRFNADKSNYEEIKKVALSLCNSKLKKENLFFHFAQLSNYNHDPEGSYFDDYEYWKYKIDFYDALKNKGNYINIKINKVRSFSPRPFCGIALKSNFVIDYNGNLYKCEHQIGQENKTVGNISDGIYYNSTYREAVVIPDIERCQSCNIFPVCNYAQCTIMQELTGGNNCECYDKQLSAIKQIAINYKEVR